MTERSTIPPQEDLKNRNRRYHFGKQKRHGRGQLELALKSSRGLRCNDCGAVKPWDDFYQHKTGKRKGQPKFACCKRCYQDRNKERHTQSNYAGLIRRKYGLTLEQYDEMRAAQDYRCAVCRRHEDELKQDPSLGKNRRLEVDHCHKVGHVRGLLCNACNLALGRLGDVPEAAFNAFQYLLYWTEREKPIMRAA